MKILEQSDSRFVVQRSPLNQMLGGAAAIAVGAVFAEVALSHGRPPFGLIGAAIVAVGALLALTATRLTVAVDKPDGTISIASKSVLRARDRAVPIADVDCVSYQERYYTEMQYHDNFWNRQSRRRDASLLALKDGSTVLLESEDLSTFDTLFAGSKDRTIDHELAAFIGVPLVSGDTPGTGETLSDIEEALGIGHEPESLVGPEDEPVLAIPPAPLAPPVEPAMSETPVATAVAEPAPVEPAQVEAETESTAADGGTAATPEDEAPRVEPEAESTPADDAVTAASGDESSAATAAADECEVEAASEPSIEPETTPEPVVEPAAETPALIAEPEPVVEPETAREPEPSAEPQPAHGPVPDPIVEPPALSPALPLTPGLFHPLPGQSFVPPADAPRPPWLS